jgi:hypothetical protein
MAAPSFVAAALGEPAPSHVRLAGRTLFVARRGETDAAHPVCGLATDGNLVSPRLLPPDQDSADLVLAVADGTPRNPLTRQPRRPLRIVADTAHLLFGHKPQDRIYVLATRAGLSHVLARSLPSAS